ncbi:MAG: hypothetical protein ACJAYI_002008, partial [Myxococcota bacterium]
YEFYPEQAKPFFVLRLVARETCWPSPTKIANEAAQEVLLRLWLNGAIGIVAS